MIITSLKDRKEIISFLKKYRELAIIGCGLCAKTCKTGGPDQVKEMADYLEDQGKLIIWTRVIDGVCQRLLVRKDIAGKPPVEAILIMACGSGVQTVSDLVDSKVFPALDSLFLGSIQRHGLYEEKCSLCGDCVVGRFDSFCPITLCPKGLLNGPCGGMDGGKCEVDSDRECVWYRIYLTKEEGGRLDELEEIVPPHPHRHRK